MPNASARSPEPSPRRWLRRLAWTAATLVALIVVAWLAVPPIARSQLESRLTEALGRRTTIEAVAFDPFSLRLTIRKLAIAGASDARSLVACDEVVADLSAASLWHRAPVLDALRILRPSLALARDRDGRYDVQDIADRAAAGPEGPPPRFSINNIEVDGGAIAFDDAQAGRKHRLEGLALGIPFVSSLPYQTDIRVTPRAEGAFNGSRFVLGGSSAPFAEPREAAIDLDLDALPLADYVAYLPVKLRVAIAGGALTTRLKVVFIDGKPGERRLEVRGGARVDDLALTRRDGSVLVAADHVRVSLDRVDLLARDARIASVAIDAPTVDVRRLADGAIELAGPWFDPLPPRTPRTEAPAAGTTAASASAPDKAWSISLGEAEIARGTVSLVDATSSFRSTLVDVTATVSNLSTRPGEKARVAVAFVSDDRIASFKGEADVEPTLPSASGRFELARFSLGLLAPFYRDALAVDVQKGSLDLAARFAVGADANLTMSEGSASIEDLRLAFFGSKAPFWRFPALSLAAIDVDARSRRVGVGEARSTGAVMRLAREPDGTLEFARLLKTAPTTGTAKDEGTWTLLVRKLHAERATVDVEDRMTAPVVRLAVRDLTLDVGDYTNARGATSTLSVRARVGNRGRVSFAGPLKTNPVALAGQLDASGLDLVPVRSYVESHVNVSLTGGLVGAKGRVTLDLPEGGAVRATWKGDVSVSDFAALDKPTSSDLARWKALTVTGLDVATEPFRLAIDRIAAEDYFARVIVYQDGTLNLQRLLTPGAAPEPAPDARPAPVIAAERTALPITIGRIELARGNVNFSDFFVRPNYAANLTDVTGTVTAMSAELAGDVAFAARVDRTAPVEVTGRIQPFAKEVSLDIAAKATDVELPPLSPYAVKYAGYGIERGKLTFDVHYRVENRRLSAENRLVLDQLTFNPQRVDSPTATKLPVLLAVALLRDARGVIDIQLPISGSLDDPQFSVGGLIVRVIVNLISKAVTAPFALLAAVFGGGEELSTVPFASGSASLGPEAQKRVDTLGKALADRPALKLDIGGRADPAGDREAMRRSAVDTAMRREKMKTLASAGTAPASVDLVTIGADERVRWLTAAYRQSSIKERPRNVIGMLKEVPPAEMEAMLLDDAKVDDDALRLLANARAQAVKDALAAKGIAGERLFLTAPRLGGEGAATAAEAAASAPAAPANGPSRVDLALR